MAVTKILAKSMRIDRLIRYVTNPDKTDEMALVSSFGCRPETAAAQMKETKRHFGQEDGVQAYHIIQSFMPDEITPELAHELGIRFIGEYLDGYEVVLGTHVDKDHIHNHIAFNSISDVTGKKYHSSPESYYKGIRAISDALCREYGLSVVMETGSKGLSYAEWKLRKAGLLSYRELLNQDVREVLGMALDIGNFYELMENRGYTIEHHSKYPSFIPDGCKVSYRAKLDGGSLTEDDIRNCIETGLETVEPQTLVQRQYIPFERHGKQHGFKALYVSWMYVLGIIGKGGSSPYPKVNHSEMKRFEQYKRQAEFLEANDIDTPIQLEAKQKSLTERTEMLTKSRTILNSKKKRLKPLFDALATVEYLSEIPRLYAEGQAGIDEDYKRYLEADYKLDGIDRKVLQQEKTKIYSDLADINAEIRKARSEIRLCEQIRKEVPGIQEKLTGKNRERQDHLKIR